MASGINPISSTMKNLLFQALANKYCFLKNLLIDKWVPGFYFRCVRYSHYQLIKI
jgi:hypothetical protein